MSDLARDFERFARMSARDGAPRYQIICDCIAGDPRLLSLLDDVSPAQRRPNLLLAAVHELLLAGDGRTGLAPHYPTVAIFQAQRAATPPGTSPFFATPTVNVPGNTESVAESVVEAGLLDDFTAFCTDRRDDLLAVIGSGATQTNEVGRCLALLPALAQTAERHRAPLSVIDLGCSAGLNLLFDRFTYTYEMHDPDGNPQPLGPFGPIGSPVTLHATWEGPFPIDLHIPDVVFRGGIDLDPVDALEDDASRWLLACQWPDHVDRFRRLLAAISVAHESAGICDFVTGDMVGTVSTVAERAPAESQLCILNTWSGAYLTLDHQRALRDTLTEIGQQRPVTWIFAEQPFEVPGFPIPPLTPAQGTIPKEWAFSSEKARSALVQVEIDVNSFRPTRLADIHPHGRWIRWWEEP